MKKILVLMVLALLLLGVACSKDKGDDNAPKNLDVAVGEPQVVNEPVRTTTTTTKTAGTETAKKIVETSDEPEMKPATKAMDPKVADLIEKQKKIKSYLFVYQTSDNWDVLRDKYYVKGNKVKAKLFEVNNWNTRHYFDTVYMDTAAQTAVAYCEDKRQVRCTDPNKEFTVGYSDFTIVLPEQWNDEIAKSTWIGTEQLDDRAAAIVETDLDDGTTARIWVDQYSGVARQVIIFRGDTENTVAKYGYRDFAINSVKDTDMEHQFE